MVDAFWVKWILKRSGSKFEGGVKVLAMELVCQRSKS